MIALSPSGYVVLYPRSAKLRIIFVFSFGSCLFIVSLFLCFGGVVSLTHLK